MLHPGSVVEDRKKEEDKREEEKTTHRKGMSHAGLRVQKPIWDILGPIYIPLTHWG